MLQTDDFGNVRHFESYMRWIDKILQRNFFFVGLMLIVCGCGSEPLAQSGDQYDLKPLQNFKSAYEGRFSADGKIVTEGTGQPASVSVVSTSDGKTICRFNLPRDATQRASALSPDGKVVAISYYTYSQKIVTRHLQLLNSSDCTVQSQIDQRTANYIGRYLSFSDDSRYLAEAADLPLVWDVAARKESFIATLPDKYYPKNALISPNGLWLATSSELFVAPDTFRSFHIANIKDKSRKELNKATVVDFTFSRDSTLLVTTEKVLDDIGMLLYTKAVVYEVGTWNIKKEFVLGMFTRSLSLSPDNSLLAIGTTEGLIKLFAMSTGKLVNETYHYKRTKTDDLRRVPHMVSVVHHIEFSPDGTMVLSGGMNGTVRLWRLIKK